NMAYQDVLRKSGLVLSGLSPDRRMVEAVEMSDHPWFVGVLFHPEFKSRPIRPHPLFLAFLSAAKTQAGQPIDQTEVNHHGHDL
ncbi:MAG: CTP synthase, partial [Bacillota bacterium]|nr:CTP synthase [Bacillota bacterium]